MDPLEELQDLIQNYLDGQRSLDDLRTWLADHAQAVADAGDINPALERLAGRAWIVLSELDAQHLDEPAAQRILAEAIVTRRYAPMWDLAGVAARALTVGQTGTSSTLNPVTGQFPAIIAVRRYAGASSS